MDGLTAIERLRAKEPEIAVVILTTFNEDDLMMRGLRLGAKGYLLKDTDRETLFNTIRAASHGETLLRPDIMKRVLAKASETVAVLSGKADLTERELEVLRGVAQGERSKEIAVRLGITERTVKAHLASIYNRLGVDSRAAAIAVAAQRGFL
jgi:NarL family two-component system response regulator YdfI